MAGIQIISCDGSEGAAASAMIDISIDHTRGILLTIPQGFDVIHGRLMIDDLTDEHISDLKALLIPTALNDSQFNNDIKVWGQINAANEPN